MAKSWAVWILAASASLPPPAGGTSTATTEPRISVRVLPGRLVMVPVSLNGRGPYPFLLDTGATCSLVDEELAESLALPPMGSVAHETTVGVGSADLVRGTLRLGSVQKEVALIRTRLDSIRDLEPTPRGVVGQDLLRLGNWWLDYRSRSLVLDADGALGAADLGERLRVHWHVERPAIDALLPDQSRLRLVLDSAASAAVLFRAPDPDAPKPARSRTLTTLDGAAPVALAAIGPLRAGRLSIPRMSAALLPGTAGRRSEDGLLPTGLFQGVYFDNRAGAVVLNPRRALLAALP